MIKAELLTDKGCPNVAAARAQLKKALEQLGLEPLWQEWQVGDSSAPAYMQGLGSPSILINEKDVSGWKQQKIITAVAYTVILQVGFKAHRLLNQSLKQLKSRCHPVENQKQLQVRLVLTSLFCLQLASLYCLPFFVPPAGPHMPGY